jgi:hypothetical protein
VHERIFALPFFNEDCMISFFSGSRTRAGVKLLCALGAIATATACGDDDDVDPFSTREVGHNIDARVARTNLAQDDTVTVVPAITDAESGDTLKPSYTFVSTSPTVASVGASTGLVTARLPGTTMIIASAFFNDSTYRDTVTITVNSTNIATSLEILTPDTTYFLGDAKAISTRLRNAAGTVLTSRARTYTSSDTSIATVSTNGTVTAKKAGTVTITLSAEGLTDVITVTVVPRPVETIVVTPNPATVNQGRTIQLTAQTIAANDEVLTGRPVVWSSANPAIATVDPNTGVVTGVAGTPTGNDVIIRATSEGKSGVTVVRVFPPSP